MAKDPAFLFYPGDWNLGTMHMTILEKGAYLELLMLQFSRGKFSLAHAKHMLNGSFDLVWATISEKFKCEGGFYWNERLQLEKDKRANFTNSRRTNALKEKIPIKKKKAHAKHMLQHMEDENINENVIDFKDEIIPFDQFWNFYDKKVGDKTKLEAKWKALTDKEREKAMLHIPEYKRSQPDKAFRKNPETYLNNKSFNDEIIHSNGNHQGITGGNGANNSKQTGTGILTDILKNEYYEIHGRGNEGTGG